MTDEQIIKIGLEAHLLNYVDNETPRRYFVCDNADLEDVKEFARLVLDEQTKEIERLREALQEYTCDCETGWCQGIRGEVCGGPARAALGEGKE